MPGPGGGMSHAQLFAEKKKLAAEKKQKKEEKAKAAAEAKAAKAAAGPASDEAKPKSDCACSACGLGLPCVKTGAREAVTYQGRF